MYGRRYGSGVEYDGGGPGCGPELVGGAGFRGVTRNVPIPWTTLRPRPFSTMTSAKVKVGPVFTVRAFATSVPLSTVQGRSGLRDSVTVVTSWAGGAVVRTAMSRATFANTSRSTPPS